MTLNRKRFLSIAAATPLLFTPFLGMVNPLGTTNTLIKPKALFKGGTLGLVAPGSPIYAESDFKKMISDLRGMGYKLKFGKHVRERNGYLAGTDQQRAADLMNMFKDPTVDGILCIRGGWGSNRILPLLDFDVIKKNPKVLIGFSDITSLHMAIQKHAGLVTFHGPVGKSEWNAFTIESFEQVVLEAETPLYIPPEDQKDILIINEGEATGPLLGGNLTVLTSMIGSEYLPDFGGAILFLEDVGEDVYRIDRMITQLELAGILKQISAFVFGKCTDCSAGTNSLSLEEVLQHHLGKYDIPAFYGAMISHEEKNITLPVGIKAEVNAGKASIRLLESAVLKN